MINERDTHFAGFARALFAELPRQPEDDSVLGIATAEWNEAVQHIIARRAYDLVKHVVADLDPIALMGKEDEEIIRQTPDLTELPED